RPGDRLLAVDGVRGSVTALRNQIGTHTCAGQQVQGCRAAVPAKLTVQRGGRTLQISVRPRYDRANKRALLGFNFGFRYAPIGVGGAAKNSVTDMWRVTKGTVSAITRLIYSSSARKQVNGVVGSYAATRAAVNTSAVDALNILAIISLSLAIVNLFPFLPLDGGHVFWALAEKVRGRRIPFSVMERAGMVGFLLIIFLFIVGLTNDINTLRGKGFGAP
ncbi:MAG: peptidase, partial [Solirubrobacteraceae bacterium]|nr:peptidase [Solirubrobacteraceae bacterium]